MIVQLHRIFTVARRSFSLGKSTRKGLEFGVYDPISIRSLLPLASSRAPRLSVPASIQRPEYATPSSSGTPHSPPSEIPLMLSSADLKSLRTSGVLAKKILKFAESLLKPGLTTEELDRLGMLYLLLDFSIDIEMVKCTRKSFEMERIHLRWDITDSLSPFAHPLITCSVTGFLMSILPSFGQLLQLTKCI